MTEKKPFNDAPKSEMVLHQTEDRSTRIECRFEGKMIWLTPADVAADDLLPSTQAATRGKHAVLDIT